MLAAAVGVRVPSLSAWWDALKVIPAGHQLSYTSVSEQLSIKCKMFLLLFPEKWPAPIKRTSQCAAMAAVVVGRKTDFGLALSVWIWCDTDLTTQCRETTGTWNGGRTGNHGTAGVTLKAFVLLGQQVSQSNLICMLIKENRENNKT